MAKKIQRRTKVDTTLGISFSLVKLPVETYGTVEASLRTPSVYEVTTASPVPTAAETMSVAPLTFYLDAGTKLDFGGIVLTTAISAQVGATEVDILPSTAAVPTGTTAETLVLIFIPGCYEANITPNFKNEDTTSYYSGLNIDQVTTQISKKMSMSFYPILGDMGTELIKSSMYDDNEAGKEFWVSLQFPSGEKHEGAGLIESASPSAALQAKRQIQCSFTILGDSYVYTPAVTF